MQYQGNVAQAVYQHEEDVPSWWHRMVFHQLPRLLVLLHVENIRLLISTYSSLRSFKGRHFLVTNSRCFQISNSENKQVCQ